MQLIYFAHIREIIGCPSEEINLSEGIKTVGHLLDFLSDSDAKYEKAFQNFDALRVAVNQNYVDFDHPISAKDEIAIFPPMTGGCHDQD